MGAAKIAKQRICKGPFGFACTSSFVCLVDFDAWGQIQGHVDTTKITYTEIQRVTSFILSWIPLSLSLSPGSKPDFVAQAGLKCVAKLLSQLPSR